MKPSNGQVVRRIGLLIEALCLLGVISLARDPGPVRSFGGIPLVRYLTVGIAIGFGFWFWGTAMIYRKPKAPRPD